MIMYVCLIYTIAYVGNDGDEDTGSSRSNAPAIAAATTSGIVVLLVIVTAIVMITLLYRYCRRRRSKGM